MKKAFVAGGSGFVGSHIATRLSKSFDVSIISRTSHKTPSGIKCITWDQLKADGFPSDTDLVVNTCGNALLNPLKRWTEEFEKECKESRFQPARDLASLIPSTVSSFVQISGVGVYPYGREHLDAVDEMTSPGDHYWGEFTKEWENCAADSQAKHVVFLRPGVVLGKDGGALSQLKMQFFLGLGGVLGDGSHEFPWIHVDDLSNLVLHCYDKAIDGPVNAVSPSSSTNAEFTNTLASAMYRPALIPTPEFVMNFVFGETRMKILMDGPRTKPAKAQSTGFQWKYGDLKDAIKACI